MIIEREIKDGCRTAVIYLDGGECEVIFSSYYNVFSVKGENDVVVALESGNKQAMAGL